METKKRERERGVMGGGKKGKKGGSKKGKKEDKK